MPNPRLMTMRAKALELFCIQSLYFTLIELNREREKYKEGEGDGGRRRRRERENQGEGD